MPPLIFLWGMKGVLLIHWYTAAIQHHKRQLKHTVLGNMLRLIAKRLHNWYTHNSQERRLTSLRSCHLAEALEGKSGVHVATAVEEQTHKMAAAASGSPLKGLVAPGVLSHGLQ